VAFGEHLGQFVAHALPADGFDFGGKAAHGGGGSSFNLKAEARGKADSAQHPQVVFFKARGWLTDGAQNAGVQVSKAVYVIDYSSTETVLVFFYLRKMFYI
jgi:hypothetical protein